MRNIILTVFISLAATLTAAGQGAAAEVQDAGSGVQDAGYAHLKDISYVDASETDAYKLERCFLDIYYPENAEGFATLVWFHGGGLEGGSKALLDVFRNRGFAVVDVNYRLSPRATCPAYIDDAAQAVAWVFNHIAEYGGDPSKISVGGHSAGGYLTLMVGLAKEYMAKFGVDADRISKLYPVSGQTTTHYTIRAERGQSRDLPLIDSLAPSANVREEGAPIMLITGDPQREMLARYEENAHLFALLNYFKHPAELYRLDGFNHVNVVLPAAMLIADDIVLRSRQ